MKWVDGIPPRDDGLPTMGEEAEQALTPKPSCQCGNPTRPGWMHIYWRSDAACYRVETNPEDTND
jgi:hypothetical protein